MADYTLLENAKLPLSKSVDEQTQVLLHGEQIAAIGKLIPLPKSVERIDLQGQMLVPGLIDLQANGGGTAFFTRDLSLQSLETIAEVHRREGTTNFLPTLVSTTWENILRSIELVREAMQDPRNGILGMHLEAPFLHPEKRGAHLSQYLKLPTDQLLRELIEAGEGVIKLLTIAPELFTSRQLAMLQESDFLLSAGHSMATYTQACDAFAAGVQKVTHLYNAMSPLQSRAPGLVGATLDHPNIWAGIIADGIHLDYAALRIAHRLKPERLMLVSDAYYVRPVQDYFEYDGYRIRFMGDCFRNEAGNLAGSAITMLDGVRNCIRHAGIDSVSAWEMATCRPADFLGLGQQLGKIEVGYRADLLVLNDDLELNRVFLAGQECTIKQ